MLLFLIKVLTSVIFWIIFFGVGFIIGSFMMKKIAPNTYEYFTTGYKDYCLLGIEIFFVCVGVYLFWPIVLLCIIIKFILSKFIFPLTGKAIKTASNVIPDIEIKK